MIRSVTSCNNLTNTAGEYLRHVHADTDEMFIVLLGRLYLDLDDVSVTLEPMEVYTVRAGVAHAPRADPVLDFSSSNLEVQPQMAPPQAQRAIETSNESVQM